MPPLSPLLANPGHHGHLSPRCLRLQPSHVLTRSALASRAPTRLASTRQRLHSSAPVRASAARCSSQPPAPASAPHLCCSAPAVLAAAAVTPRQLQCRCACTSCRRQGVRARGSSAAGGAYDEPPEISGRSGGGLDLPSFGESIIRGVGDLPGVQLAERPPADIDYLAELIAIQKEGPKNIGFFGTRNMGFLHQQLIEILSYAMVLTDNHLFTSGATGTNAAVIRGALRAERPDLLTVVLPQSLSRQPPESQELLQQVTQLVEMPQNDEMTLLEASRVCNQDITGRVQQVICFAFHDSRLLLETCVAAKEQRKMVTLFYLD